MKPEDLDIEDYNEAIAVFHDESDRGAAVLAGSFIESYLAGYIKSKMIENAPTEVLFDSNGPLSTYAQRRAIAFSFGLIDQRQYSDLNYIGKIRNHFAHHPKAASFEKAPVTDWCNNLSAKTMLKEQYPGKDANFINRNSYIASISMCIGAWHNAMLAAKKGGK